jgi:DNA repair protein RecN (Recombination protein N)
VIEQLRIRDWVIVESAELELGPGLNVLTGETGTGKSIVLGALSLLAGGRASPDAVRTGAESASIEAVFSVSGAPELAAELSRRELRADSGELLVERTIARAGRSRVRVAGELVPVSTLAELFEGRIEISSQHSSQTLLRHDVQGRLLDEAGGLLPLRSEVLAAVGELRALDRELLELRGEREDRARRHDFLAFQLREIDELGLRPGEIAELESAHARLAHADRLVSEGAAACAALVGGETGGETGDAPGAADRLAAAARIVAGLAALDPGLAEISERLRAQESELFEAARDLERYLQRIESDPAQLARIEDRMAALERMKRKYGRSEDEIMAFRARAAAELESVQSADARADGLGAERERRVRALAELAAKLTAGRRTAAGELAAGVEGELASLAMPGARFRVRLDPAESPPGLPCGGAGAEQVAFEFSANAGEPARDLRLVASGGELSRVFLAVRNALRKSGAGMVLVFDEVDAGIGGRVAERVGRALSELSRHHQVLCITHLPQIAAFGDVHFRVSKVERAGRALARVEAVAGEARVDEIARMAGGEAVTAATRRHARELLRAKGLAP